jgi:carboxymethylenebutenolidase
MKSAPLSRRTMLSSAAAAAGYTLAAGPVSADAIKTDTTDIDVGETTIKVAEGDMPVYYARSKLVEKPTVILVAMEVFGLHEYIKDVTRRLAKLGALAVAPNYYFTKGDLTKISDIKEIMPLVNAKPDAELIADLDATLDWALTQNVDENGAGMIGFCRGGRSVWVYAAHSDRLAAAASFYGSLVDPPEQKAIWPKSPLELAGEVKTPVIGFYGEEDQGIALADVKKMKAALEAAGGASSIVTYPGAGHGFHADYRPSYNQDAAESAWQEMITWFKGHGLLENGGDPE